MHKDHVKAAAARLLALRPAATMDDLAAAAEVSRATLFRMFPNRTSLVMELSRDAVGRYIKAIDDARPEQGPPDEAMERLLVPLSEIATTAGLLALQPLPDLLESELLAEVETTDRRIRALTLRGQEDGVFRVDLPTDWVLLMITWLLVGASDGLRLGLVARAELPRLVRDTVLGALRREPTRSTPEVPSSAGGVEAGR
jgi:TetR/AcrR family transcriptional regulator, mexCD-oprJ operon repressor